MQWYYVKDGERLGPVDEATFQQLIQSGTVQPDTLVWHEGMANWLPYANVSAQPTEEAPLLQCSQCGQYVKSENVVRFDDTAVCSGCKDAYVQRMREGLPSKTPRYAPGGTIASEGKPVPNSDANTGLILSCVGLACCQLLCIAGLIISLRAYNACKEDPNLEGKGAALAGAIIGGIGIALFVLQFLVFGLMGLAGALGK